MRKKRILFVGEASYISTGYSTYAKEVLTRLYNTGKYDLAEFGCFGNYNDQQAYNPPWKFYSNLPNPNNDIEVNYYHSNRSNFHGAWKFEKILLDFLPDIVFDIRDAYMCSFEETSPLRKYYHLIWMPPVDSIPQQPQWIASYLNADS